MFSRILTAIALTGWMSAASFAQAEPQGEKPTTSGATKIDRKIDKKSAKAAKISTDREQELLSFVHEHHPELAELLEQLKPRNSDQYRAALKDLDRDVRRIEGVRKGVSDRSDAELELWKSRSRIRLLAARLTVSTDEELRDRLRDELRQLRRLEQVAVQRDLALAEQSLERQRRKQEQLKERAADLAGDDESWVERQLADLERKQRRTQEVIPKKSARSKPQSKSKNALD